MAVAVRRWRRGETAGGGAGQAPGPARALATCTRFTRLAGLLAAVAALGVSGCTRTGAASADELPADAREAIRRVADVLAQAGSSHALTAMEMASGGTRVTVHAEGRFDYAERVGELRVTLPREPGAEGGRRPVTEVFVPGVLYMKNRGAGVPPGKWLRIDVTTVADGNLVTGGATDPITAAELLRGVRRAEEVGEVRVDGERLWHYEGVTDIAAAARAASGEVREQLAAAAVGAGFTDTAVPFDAYLDEDGLLRKVVHRFSYAGAAGAAATGRPAGFEVASTVMLHDFGVPVEVTMPRPRDVYTGEVV